jgi:site-specific DNA-methyltransferase (adenine-specific)
VTGVLHIVLARKPIEGTVAENCLQWGCGALWIDGTRVGMMTSKEIARSGKSTKADGWGFNPKSWKAERHEPLGRFPANLILGGEEVVGLFPETTSVKGKPRKAAIKNQTRLKNSKNTFVSCEYSDSGSASRFFFNFSEQEADE